MRQLLIATVLSGATAHLLAAQTAPSITLGRAPFNGLNARVAAIRFFEGAGVVPDPKQRVVTTRFDALTTRFIFFELELAYGAAAKQTAFQVACRFEGPNDLVLEKTISGKVEAGWTGSYHVAGVGSAERGQWKEGRYKVNCTEEGKQIVAAELEIVKGAAAVGKLGAAIVQMKTYQSVGARAPVETRRYSTRFDTKTARWIKTEFALVYPQLAAVTSFSVECAYVFPDRSVKRVTVERQIPAGWTGSAHVQGIESERWPVGKYAVSCWNNGEKMAERTFEVFGDGPGGREENRGKLRFHAGKAGSAADPSYQTSFPAGSFDSLLVEASVPTRATADSTSFDCTATDPAGITSGFRLTGAVIEKEKALVARGAMGFDGAILRGRYRVECRSGRGSASDGFEVTGNPEIPVLDARVISSALFASEEEPGDESVPDVVFSAAKLKSLWLVALLDHPSETGTGNAGYSCRISGGGPRAAILSDPGPQTLSILPGQRAVLLKQKLVLLPRQRWAAGKYVASCMAGAAPLVRVGFDLTR